MYCINVKKIRHLVHYSLCSLIAINNITQTHKHTLIQWKKVDLMGIKSLFLSSLIVANQIIHKGTQKRTLK